MGSRFEGIQKYIDSLEGEGRIRVEALCALIEDLVPQAVGRISYQMPAYFLGDASLVYFAAFKKHVGFYPASDAVFDVFRDELASYPQSGRGTVQFPYRQPLPLDVVRRIVGFRVERLAGS